MSNVVDTAVQFSLWPQILGAHGRIVQALPPTTQQAMMALVESYEVEPRDVFHFIYVVENFDASALSTAHYQKRDPFDHPHIVDAFLTESEANGFLQKNHDGTLRITEKGVKVRQKRWNILNAALADLALLPEATLTQLNGMLARVVAETAVATTKEAAWAFHTRRQHGLRPPVEPLSPLAQFIELRMDLGAFRDDAHLASWREQHAVSPHAWEILGELWQGGTTLLDALLSKLNRRGFSQEETAVALDELVGAGWVKQKQQAFQLTSEGHAVRQDAEETTNNIFYAPWSVLSSSELENMQTLLDTF